MSITEIQTINIWVLRQNIIILEYIGKAMLISNYFFNNCILLLIS